MQRSLRKRLAKLMMIIDNQKAGKLLGGNIRRLVPKLAISVEITLKMGLSVEVSNRFSIVTQSLSAFQTGQTFPPELMRSVD